MTIGTLRPEEVAKYLKDHPEFFDEYAELLSGIYVPHPYGGHAIPLAERQVLNLRERSRALEGKLRELVQFGEENDTISDRVHRISLALLAARDLPGVLQVLDTGLREDFAVPEVALRLWSSEPDSASAEVEPVSDEARVFADSLASPYFSDRPMFESAEWFGMGGEVLRSFAYVSLRADRPLGVLAMASPEPDRFTSDMGTLYVARLGELAGTAVRRHLPD
ncbi:MAG TPA: DUF484 family protein [Burkholderiales bacterium]|nr:DUF484 family protein [Burkholderiales bacterium]